MEFKEIIRKRRSIRKFTDRPVARETVEELLQTALTAPSSRNTRSTSFIAVDDRETLARMADMRDYGSAFMAGAPAAVVVTGDTAKSDLWRENCAIAATLLQLAAVDAGLASCWIHVDGRPRRKEHPDGESAMAYLRTLLPIPADHEALCIIALGYSDFEPKPLPPFDAAEHIRWK